jgi:tyrosyl-tRNA synthetase
VPDSPLLASQSNDDSFDDIWDELVWRGLIQVSTDPKALKALLAGPPITHYCGFDPTAPSLHLGNLVQLLVLRRLQLAGHHPLGLVGGSTGLIGDPRPTAERTLQDREVVADWVVRLQAQVRRFLSEGGDNPMRLVNNLDWTAPLSAIDFLRDIGKHFRLATMLKKDAVQARLASDAGISYTEFSYQILQGLDFLELNRRYGCVLETGGSDQWGNLTSGTDLVRRVDGVTVHAFGTPLITNSDGTKFGKSEGNAIWLDPDMTSPYAFYQFWINTADADVIERLKVFTFLTRAEIDDHARRLVEAPAAREAQRRLAHEVTSLVHGTAAADAAAAATDALFGRGDVTALTPQILRQALAELPHITVAATDHLDRVLVETGLTSSLGEARRAVQQGGVSLNGIRVTDSASPVGPRMTRAGMAVVKRGKKSLAGLFLGDAGIDTPGARP